MLGGRDPVGVDRRACAGVRLAAPARSGTARRPSRASSSAAGRARRRASPPRADCATNDERRRREPREVVARAARRRCRSAGRSRQVGAEHRERRLQVDAHVAACAPAAASAAAGREPGLEGCRRRAGPRRARRGPRRRGPRCRRRGSAARRRRGRARRSAVAKATTPSRPDWTSLIAAISTRLTSACSLASDSPAADSLPSRDGRRADVPLAPASWPRSSARGELSRPRAGRRVARADRGARPAARRVRRGRPRRRARRAPTRSAPATRAPVRRRADRDQEQPRGRRAAPDATAAR